MQEIHLQAQRISAQLPEVDPLAHVQRGLERAGLPRPRAAFVADRMARSAQASGARDDIAVHAAFLSLLLDPRSLLARAVESIAETTHLRTAGALLPYVDPEDLHSLLRWRLFALSGRYLKVGGAIRHPGLIGFLATVARNLALDELRKPSAKISELPERAPMTSTNVEQVWTAFDSVDRAFRRATANHPIWLADLVLSLLLEMRDRDETLAEINRRRDAEGLPTWSPNALSAYLKRVRAAMRAELARDPLS